jgi:nicotinamide-nucleotide adenylyltransferase
MRFDAAYVGRFQPFHFGHLFAVMQILAKNHNVLIIIGSAEKYNSNENPYSYLQRKEFIEIVLKSENVDASRFKIVPLADIGDDSKWVDYLITSVPKFEVMYTGSESTKKLFLESGKIPVSSLVMLEGVSGTKVRERLRLAESVEGLVHSSLQNLI